MYVETKKYESKFPVYSCREFLNSFNFKFFSKTRSRHSSVPATVMRSQSGDRSGERQAAVQGVCRALRGFQIPGYFRRVFLRVLL
jgi:hypothetical protein